MLTYKVFTYTGEFLVVQANSYLWNDGVLIFVDDKLRAVLQVPQANVRFVYLPDAEIRVMGKNGDEQILN